MNPNTNNIKFKIMKINAKDIESLGGLVTWGIKPNTPNIPEIDEIDMETYLFDGHGVFEYNNKYYKISYPKLEETQGSEEMVDTINEYRYANQRSCDFEITVDDVAITFGMIEVTKHSEYVSFIVDGLIDNIGRMIVEDGENEVLSAAEYEAKLRMIEKSPPKYLYLYQNYNELVEEFDGKIYSVKDENGEHLCDVLEEDLVELEGAGVIRPTHNDDDLNDVIITAADKREKVLATRFEAILFIKRK